MTFIFFRTKLYVYTHLCISLFYNTHFRKPEEGHGVGKFSPKCLDDSLNPGYIFYFFINILWFSSIKRKKIKCKEERALYIQVL